MRQDRNHNKNMKNILKIPSLFLLLGCLATQPIDTVSQVKIINFEQTKDLNCTEIDSIEAFGKKSMTADADRRNALTEFRIKIAEKGGNAGVISNQLSSKAGFKISGYAWNCESLNERI
jgi:hypothetical protein